MRFFQTFIKIGPILWNHSLSANRFRFYVFEIYCKGTISQRRVISGSYVNVQNLIAVEFTFTEKRVPIYI